MITWGSTINSSRDTEVIYDVRYLGVRHVLLAFVFIKSQSFWEWGGGAGAVPTDPSYPALKIYFLPAIFRLSKVTTCNSKANSLIWHRNRPRSKFIPVIVTFMFIPPVYEVYRGIYT